MSKIEIIVKIMLVIKRRCSLSKIFIFFGLLFLIVLLTIPHIFSLGFRSGEFAGQSSTPTPWSFNQLVVLLAVWAGAKSCWKMKSAFLKSWLEEGSSPKFLNRFCLTILIRLRFSRLVVHLFLPHFFLPLNFLLTCLDTALCEQLLWQWMFVSYPPCEGCQWLSSGQLSDQQSSSWLCRLVNQTETILKAHETFAGVLSWLSDWHVTYSNLLRCELVGFCLKCEPKSSQLKEPKT